MLYAAIVGDYNPHQPRFSKLVRSLTRLGRVTVLCSKVPVGVKPMDKNVAVVGVGGSSKASFAARVRAYLKPRLREGDAVMGYMHIGALAASLAAGAANARGNARIPYFYDYPDPWKGWYYKGTVKDSVAWELGRVAFQHLENNLYRGAALVTTASYEQLAFLQHQHGSHSNALTVLNCPDTAWFKPASAAQRGALAKKLGLKGKTVLFYLGAILEEYGADTLLESFPVVLEKIPAAALVYLGSAKDAAFLARLKSRARELGVAERVKFLPAVPPKQVPSILSLAALGFVPFKDRFYNHVGSPNKLFEYMAAGVVPVVSDMKEFHHYLREGENGFFVPPENARDLADAAVHALQNPARLKKMQENNFRLTRTEYNWRVQEKRFLDAVERALRSA